MAEAAVSIVGLVLAWKGIVEFGKLVHKFADDDDLDRRSIAINLECSQMFLQDWGNYWGLDQNDGAISRLDERRQLLIKRLIEQLNDVRKPAERKLDERYGLISKEEPHPVAKSGDVISKMADSVVARAKRSKRKVQWVSGDDKLLQRAVVETDRLLESLNRLTYMSGQFFAVQIDALLKAGSLECHLEEIRDKVKEYTHLQRQGLPDSARINCQRFSGSIDEQTMISYATDSTMLSSQREAITKCIDHSIHRFGDDRVPQIISTWWKDPEAHILVLEFPDQAEDDTAISACVLLYYLATCHRLVFIFEPYCGKSLELQLLGMMQTFISSLVPLPQNKVLLDDALGPSIAHLDAASLEAKQLAKMVTSFLTLLENSLQTNSQHILVIIGGLEVSGLHEEGTTSQILLDLVEGMYDISVRGTGSQNGLKVLLTHKGYVRCLYNKVGSKSVVDCTSRGLSQCNLYTELISAFGE